MRRRRDEKDAQPTLLALMEEPPARPKRTARKAEKDKRSVPAKRDPRLPVFITRSGPRSGPADCEAAFRSKAEAVGFLVNAHGLTVVEGRRLAKDLRLKLDRKWHGSETCSIREVPMTPDEACRALSGDLFLAA